MKTPSDYTNISRPYNNLLERGTQDIVNVGSAGGSSDTTTSGAQSVLVTSGGISSGGGGSGGSTNNGSVETMPVKDGGAMGDVWIENFIRSKNWKPKTVGFYIDGQSGYAEFADVYVSGEIEAQSGQIGGFTIGDTDLSVTSGGNTTILSSGATAFSAGPTGSPSVTITQAGALIATSGSIAGWEIQSNLLRSAPSGARIELNKEKDRISIFDAVNEKVVMGYLNGLMKHDGTGYWGPGDYGFWALAGDKLSIDGDGEYINGDWIVQNDAAYLINDGSGRTIVRLGTDSGEKGLFIYDIVGRKLAKYISDQIYVGSATQYLQYTVAGGLVIVGSITATTGAIGGWVITATALKDAAGTVGMSSAVTGGDDIRFWAGDTTPASAEFYVTEAGALVATSATITGAITANTGYIGGTSGWVITAGSISSVNAGNTTTMASGGTDAYIAGTTGAPQFKVTHAGALTATSATITGAITATTGAIGGWVVDATSIKDVAGVVGMSSAITVGDDIRFFAGNVTPASAPFYVTEAGALVATSATISGLFRTAVSGERVEINSTDKALYLYNASDAVVVKLNYGTSNGDPYLAITHENANRQGLKVATTSTTTSYDSIVIDNDSNSGTSSGLNIDRDGTLNNASLFAVIINCNNAGTGADGIGVGIDIAVDGVGIRILNPPKGILIGNSTTRAIEITRDNSAGGIGIYIENASNETSAHALQIDRDGANLADIYAIIINCDNSTTASKAVAIEVNTGGTVLKCAGTPTIGIDVYACTNVLRVAADATDPTGGGGAAAGRIPVLVDSTLKYIAYY
jgi:hypothetical protein